MYIMCHIMFVQRFERKAGALQISIIIIIIISILSGLRFYSLRLIFPYGFAGTRWESIKFGR